MNTLGLGIALVILGLLLSFSNVFGFVVGVPLIYLGWILVLVGIGLAIYHMFASRTDTGEWKGPGRTM